MSSDEFRLSHENNSQSNNGRSLLVYYVTGNPGTNEFIVEFLETLHESFVRHPKYADYKSVSIVSTCHMNHHLLEDEEHPLDSSFDTHGLQSQINYHKTKLIGEINQNLLSSDNKLDVMLVGHSIGCYMLLDIIDTTPEVASHVTDILMLAPFIFWSRLPLLHRIYLNIGTFNKTLSLHVAKLFLKMLWSLNESVRHFMISSLTDAKGKYVSIIANKLLSNRFVHNFLEMGYDEIMIIPQHEDRIATVLKDLELRTSDTTANAKPINIMGIYTTNDKWAPLDDLHHLRDILSDSAHKFKLIPDITHAFTLAKSNYEQVCHAVGEILHTTMPMQNKDLRPSTVPKKYKKYFLPGVASGAIFKYLTCGVPLVLCVVARTSTLINRL